MQLLLIYKFPKLEWDFLYLFYAAIKKGLEPFTCAVSFAALAEKFKQRADGTLRLCATNRYDFSGSWPEAVEKEASLLAWRERAPR